MRVRFQLTLWSSTVTTNNGHITHCPELNTSYEAKSHSSGKSWFAARVGIDKQFDYWIKRGTLEDELLCRGWVLLKTYGTIQWHFPNSDAKVYELQQIFREEGVMDRYSIERDIPHKPRTGTPTALPEVRPPYGQDEGPKPYPILEE